MENAQLVSLSRQIGLQRQMDVVANNLANITTTGFKAENLLFEEYVMPVAKDRDFAYPDQPLSYTQDWATIHDLANGPIEMTGGEFDLAIQGDGFFTVQTDEGEKYTKSGAFLVDATGTLVTLNGDPVLSDSGPIQFDPSEGEISISATGFVSSSAGGKGMLKLAEFDNPQELARDGNNLFSGSTPQAATGTVVVQGALERSNVSGVSEMAEMIRVTRSYESVTSIMQKQDELRRSAIQRLGNLQA
ncbi:MAG: flgF [Devosia sp.]|nr:flgF [Devosia sp.]